MRLIDMELPPCAPSPVSPHRRTRRARLRWDPDLSPRVVGLNPQGWEDDHNEEEQAYP